MAVEISGLDRLVDDPGGLRVDGLPPDGEVELTVDLDYAGTRHRAVGSFVADGAGCVDTARDVSHRGTYSGQDPFGLFWSGRPTDTVHDRGLAPIEGSVRAAWAGGSVAWPLRRRWQPADARVESVNEDGVVGMFCRPSGVGPFPAVITLAGSSGGLGPAATWAATLAGHGFAALALGYFAMPGLPNELCRIPVECVERAISWLRRHDEIRRARIGVVGISRGSELALLSGALIRDDVGCVVALSPSGVMWPALGHRGPIDAPAWTWRAAPLPYVPILDRPSQPVPGAPLALTPLFERALADSAAVEAATIPVEQSCGPILLVSGEADAMWPSSAMAEITLARATEHSAPELVTHLRYPAAGHTGVGLPGIPSSLAVNHPLDGGHYAFGGTHAGNAAARADSWPKVIAHLQAADRPDAD